MTDDDELMSLLMGETPAEEDQPEEADIPSVIPVSTKTLAAAHDLCQIVKATAGRSYEWYSLLYASRSDPNHIARGFIVPEDVDVWPGFVHVNGTVMAKTIADLDEYNKENGTDYYSIGWLHSHGAVPVGFSNEDIENFERLMNTVGRNTRQRALAPLNLIEGAQETKIENGKIVLSGKHIEDSVLKYQLLNPEAFEALLARHRLTHKTQNPEAVRETLLREIVEELNVRAYEPRVVGFGYSIVVNDAQMTPHGVLGTVEENLVTKNGNRRFAMKTVSVVPTRVKGDVRQTKSELVRIAQESLKYQQYKTTNSARVSSPHSRREQFTTAGSQQAFFPREGPSPVSPTVSARSGSITTYQSPKRQIARKTRDGLNVHELSQLFTIRAVDYLVQWRQKYAKYSSYMDELIWSIDLRLPNGGVTAGVTYVGELFPDGAEVMMPRFRLTSAGYVIDKIRQYMPTDPQHPERAFVQAFAYSTHPNKTLEEHIPRILAFSARHAAQKLPPVPTTTGVITFPANWEKTLGLPDDTPPRDPETQGNL
jgi:hypothetical protein